MNALLHWLRVQPRPWRALVRAFFLMDLRSQHYGRATGAKPGELIPPLFWVVGQFLFTSCIASAILFARVSVEAFAFVGLAMSMLLALTAVIVEFNEVVLDTGDLNIVGCRPVSQRTYAAARLANLGFYWLLVTTAVNIFPAVLGAALRDAGPWYLPAYVFAGALGNAAVMLLAVLLYSAHPPRRDQADWRDLLAWTQIILAMVAFYGAQLILRDRRHLVEVWLDAPPPWVEWLPPMWLAKFVASAATAPALAQLQWAGAALAITALLALATWHRLAQFYARAQPALAPAAPKEGRDAPFVAAWLRRIFPQRRRAAATALCLTLLRRDHDLRMRLLPNLGTMIAVVVLGLCTGQLGNPLAGAGERGVLSIAAVQLIVIAVPSLLHNVKFSRDHVAAWVLETAPVPPRVLSDAARLTLCHAILLPALAALWVVFSIAWRQPVHAAVHCALGWLAVLGVSHLTLRAMQFPVPFAQPAARGDVLGAVVPYIAGVSTIAMALGAAEYFAANTQWGMVTLAAVLLVVWLLARGLPSKEVCRA